MYQRVSTVCVTQKKADDLWACNVFDGDVIISKVGDPPGVAAAYSSIDRSIVTQDVVRIRPRDDIDRDFLVHLLNSDLGRKQIESIEITGTRKRFSLTDFKNIFLPKPCFDEQVKMSRTISSFVIKTEKARKKMDKLRDLKKGLMQDLLTGKVRVKV